MSYAPDPNSFTAAGQVFDYMAPTAAMEIVLPAFTFGFSSQQLSHLIYMNQCNPADIMAVGASWLQMAEKYLTAGNRLDDRVDGLEPDAWDGEDRNKWQDHAGKVSGQIVTIGAFALEVGIAMMTIGAILAVVVTAYSLFATALFAMAVAYWAAMCVPVVGQGAAQAIRGAAMSVGGVGYSIVKGLDTAVTVMAKQAAAFIGAGMTVSWAVLAANDNVVNPLKVAGPALTQFVQGYAQFLARNYMAPGGGKHAKFGPSNLFMGGQGVYNFGMNYSDNNQGAPSDWRNKSGTDPGNLDVIPNFPRPSWMSDPDAPTWR